MMSRPNSILLVDRAADEREMYAEYLCGQGYCTLQAQNAVDAFRLATEQRATAVQAGCDVFLGKPCLPDELAWQIEHLLGAARTPPAQSVRRRSRLPIDLD